jgi:hypothetical protein
MTTFEITPFFRTKMTRTNLQSVVACLMESLTAAFEAQGGIILPLHTVDLLTHLAYITSPMRACTWGFHEHSTIVHLFENQNICIVCLHCHLFGTFRRIDNGQIDGETEGQVGRKWYRGTYKPADAHTGRGTYKQG